MKKHLLSLLAGIALSTGNLFAVPACPDPAPVTQPDGSVLTVRLVGDEFLNYVTTLDGYTLIQKGNNGYSYATEVNGEIVASDIMAHDAAQRTPSEKAYLQGVKKHLVPSQSPAKASMRSDRSKMVVRPGEKGLYDYNNFHGLIILVNYNDRQFTFDDPKTLFQDIVAKENFTGFDYPNGSHQTYTGSVRDYFWDNSYHQFSPQFDVIGPVTVPYSQYYVNQTDNIRTVIRARSTFWTPPPTSPSMTPTTTAPWTCSMSSSPAAAPTSRATTSVSYGPTPGTCSMTITTASCSTATPAPQSFTEVPATA